MVDFSEEKQKFPVGWGSNIEKLKQPKDVKVLPAEDAKKFWDHEASQFHTKFTGKHSTHLDQEMQIGFDDIELLSIRQQRQIIKQRAVEMHRHQAHRYKNRKLGMHTRMLDERLARSQM